MAGKSQLKEDAVKLFIKSLEALILFITAVGTRIKTAAIIMSFIRQDPVNRMGGGLDPAFKR
jgi:hypothetical protein